MARHRQPQEKISTRQRAAVSFSAALALYPYEFGGHQDGKGHAEDAVRLHGAAARGPAENGAPARHSQKGLFALRLHAARHPGHRIRRGPARQGRRRDRKTDIQVHEGRLGPRAQVRPDGPPGEVRRRQLRKAPVPLPPLPDRQGLARRARPARPLPRVLPGRYRRHRRREAGHHERSGDPLHHLPGLHGARAP